MDELALAKVRRFCAERTPEDLRDRIRLEVTTRGNAITIVERRPPWLGPADGQWTSMNIARFRFDPSDRLWRLDWADRNGRWNELRDVEPSPTIEPLLAEVAEDPPPSSGDEAPALAESPRSVLRAGASTASAPSRRDRRSPPTQGRPEVPTGIPMLVVAPS